MCSDVIHDPRFAQLLYHFDVDLARQAQAKGCLHCGGRLDVLAMRASPAAEVPTSATSTARARVTAVRCTAVGSA